MLSSGKVVGDPDSWKVVKSNRFTELGKDASGFDENVKDNTTITDSLHINKGTWELQQGESTKSWVTQVFGKSSADQTKVLDGKVDPAKDNINEKQISKNKNIREEADMKEIMDENLNMNQVAAHQITEHKMDINLKLIVTRRKVSAMNLQCPILMK